MHMVPMYLVNQILEEMPAELHISMERGADVLISVSGGADSDAMTYLICEARQLRGWRGRFQLVHADLGRMDWPQTGPHVTSLAKRIGLSIDIVRREEGDLLDTWQHRYETMLARGQDAIPFSSAKARFCTSYHKRDVLASHARRFTPRGTVVSAQGIQQQESSTRAAYKAFEVNEDLTTKARQAFTWYPIFTFSREQVWEACGTTSERLAFLRLGVQQLRGSRTTEQIMEWISTTDWPCHPSYVLGAERLSCCLCILANRQTLEAGAEGNPEIYRRVVDLEILSGKSFQPNRWLGGLRPDLLRDDQRDALEGITGIAMTSHASHQLSLF